MRKPALPYPAGHSALARQEPSGEQIISERSPRGGREMTRETETWKNPSLRRIDRAAHFRAMREHPMGIPERTMNYLCLV